MSLYEVSPLPSHIHKRCNLFPGLRKRISSLFMQYCRTPLFNPEAAKLIKVPKDPATLCTNVYYCRSCGQYLPSTDFELSANSRWVWSQCVNMPLTNCVLCVCVCACACVVCAGLWGIVELVVTWIIKHVLGKTGPHTESC